MKIEEAERMTMLFLIERLRHLDTQVQLANVVRPSLLAKLQEQRSVIATKYNVPAELFDQGINWDTGELLVQVEPAKEETPKEEAANG